MSLIFKQEQRTLYLDSFTDVQEEKNVKYNIILSPHLYWVKKISLPFKYAREVKKIAHTLFEESIPQDVNYSYFVYKKGQDYFVFAYDDKKILALLQEKSIGLTSIASIYFAQSELDTLEDAYVVNDTEALEVKDGIVILLPREWFENLPLLDVEKQKLSKHKITLQQFGGVIESKMLYKIIILLLVLAGILLVEWLVYKNQKEHISQTKEKIFSKYGLKPTMMQNKAILSHYETIDKKQRELRKYIGYFLHVKLKKSQKINKVEYSNGKLQVVLSNIAKSEQKRILAPFYKHKIPYNVHFKNAKMYVEVPL